MADFISSVEATAVIPVTLTQLENWRSRNYGPPYFKIGHLCVYDRAELLKWFAATRRVPTALTPYAEVMRKAAAARRKAAAARRKAAASSRSRKVEAHATA